MYLLGKSQGQHRRLASGILCGNRDRIGTIEDFLEVFASYFKGVLFAQYGLVAALYQAAHRFGDCDRLLLCIGYGVWNGEAV